MMNNKKIAAILLSTLLLVTGCSSKEAASTSNGPAASNSGSKPSETSSQPAAEKFYAPYTGEEVTKEVASKPAFMAIIENSAPARPQSGFTEADIVYEAMAEGGITRMLAVFQKEDSPKIGPIRSMRTYFLDIALEYNLPFAHAGGSHDALDRIKAEKPMSMNEFTNTNFYWRDKTIKIQEHNLYTNSVRMTDLAKAKKYVVPPAVKLSFDKEYWDKVSSSQTVNTATIKFNGSYTTAYTFKDGLYYKSMNNKPTQNKEDKKDVAVKNVVIQNVKYSTRPNEAYLDADLIGEGDGYIISNGKAVKVTWSKKDLKSQTIFKDESGNVVPLNPGKTWWHILDQNAKLTIE